MIILGIDPGIARMGWGVVSHEKNKTHAVAYGCYETASTGPLPYRLASLRTEILRIVEKYNPEKVGIEQLFFNTNTKTAMTVGQARGVIIEALAEKNIPIESITPLEVKLAVTGYGRAEKAQIGTMVKMLLHLEAIPKPDDTADALAIALACAFTKKYA